MDKSRLLIGVTVEKQTPGETPVMLTHPRNKPPEIFPRNKLTRLTETDPKRMAYATIEDMETRQWRGWKVSPVFQTTS